MVGGCEGEACEGGDEDERMRFGWDERGVERLEDCDIGCSGVLDGVGLIWKELKRTRKGFEWPLLSLQLLLCQWTQTVHSILSGFYGQIVSWTRA